MLMDEVPFLKRPLPTCVHTFFDVGDVLLLCEKRHCAVDSFSIMSLLTLSVTYTILFRASGAVTAIGQHYTAAQHIWSAYVTYEQNTHAAVVALTETSAPGEASAREAQDRVEKTICRWVAAPVAGGKTPS